VQSGNAKLSYTDTCKKKSAEKAANKAATIDLSKIFAEHERVETNKRRLLANGGPLPALIRCADMGQHDVSEWLDRNVKSSDKDGPVSSHGVAYTVSAEVVRVLADVPSPPK